MSDLATLYARCATDLGDSGYTIWTTAMLTNFIRQALTRYNAVKPRRLSTTINSTAGVREYDVSAVTFLRITAIWYPWDSTAPFYPPIPRGFVMLDDETLYLSSVTPTGGTDDIRIFYTAAHTIDDLDSATDTTLDAAGEALIELLATALAGMERAQYTTGRVTVHAWTPRQLLEWATARYEQAEAQLATLAISAGITAGGSEEWDT